MNDLKTLLPACFSARRVFLLGVILLAGASVLVPASPAVAQEPERPELFVDVVDVNLINVEVIVTQNGRPVDGLTKDDFLVLDDGKPVEITNFYAVEDGERAAVDTAPDGPQLETPPSEVSAVIVVVDNTFISPASRKKILNALRNRLDEVLARGARVMVVNKDQDLWIEERFTPDRVLIDAAIDRIERAAGTSNLNLATVTRLIREIESGSRAGSEIGENDARETLASVRDHAEQMHQNVRRTTSVLRRFLGSMSGMPGRKALFYVSDRLPLSPGEELFNVWMAKYGRVYGPDMGILSSKDVAIEFDTTSLIVDLIADAAASRVAFYPIGDDVSPIRRALSARNESALVTTSFAASNPEPPDQAGLLLLARGTGGDAAFGVKNADHVIDQMQADFSHFYSLGYLSPHGGDGESHRVKVKVKRPGAEVRYLDTYRDKSQDQEMNDQMFASLFFETTANPLGVALEVGEVEPHEKNQFLLPVAVKFPLKSVTLLPQEEMYIGDVSIFVLSRDREGRTSKPAKIPVPLRIPNEAMPGARERVAAYATRLAVRGGEQTIAVGVRDELTKQSSTLSVTVEVGDGKKSGKKSGKKRGQDR